MLGKPRILSFFLNLLKHEHSCKILYIFLFQPEIKDALKRVCTVLYDKGAVIRNMENLGSKELPYSMKKNGVKHQQGK